MEFILMGLSRQPASQLLLLGDVVHLICHLGGYILIIVIIRIDSHLHTPHVLLSQPIILLRYLLVYKLHTHGSGELLEGLSHYIL